MIRRQDNPDGTVTVSIDFPSEAVADQFVQWLIAASTAAVPEPTKVPTKAPFEVRTTGPSTAPRKLFRMNEATARIIREAQK